MGEKFWVRADEWVQYAPCAGVEDFTLPPSRPDNGPVADIGLVLSTCLSCLVRPECARAAAAEDWNGVWSCGVYIPSHDEDKREAIALRQNLSDSVEEELDRRGEDV